MYLLHAPSCTVLCHQGWGTTLGYNQQEVNERLIRDSIHPEESEQAVAIMRMLKTKALVLLREKYKEKQDIPEHVLQMRYRMQHRDGRYLKIFRESRILQVQDDGTAEYIFTTCKVLYFEDNNDFYLDWELLGPDAQLLEFLKSNSPVPEGCPLSKRELEILRYINQGFESKEIAEVAFVSKHTVNTHRRNILSKLDVKNTRVAVEMALRKGWIRG